MIKHLLFSILLLTTCAQSMDHTSKLSKAIQENNFDAVQNLIGAIRHDLITQDDRAKITKICSETMQRRTQDLPYNSAGLPIAAIAGLIPLIGGAYHMYKRAYNTSPKDPATELLYGFGDAFYMEIGSLLIYMGIGFHAGQYRFKNAAAINQLLISKGIVDAQEVNNFTNNSSEDNV